MTFAFLTTDHARGLVAAIASHLPQTRRALGSSYAALWGIRLGIVDT